MAMEHSLDTDETEAVIAGCALPGTADGADGAGEAGAMGVLRKVRGDADTARKTINACLDAAGGTGRLSPAQAAMARRLCESLNLSPLQFGF